MITHIGKLSGNDSRDFPETFLLMMFFAEDVLLYCDVTTDAWYHGKHPILPDKDIWVQSWLDRKIRGVTQEIFWKLFPKAISTILGHDPGEFPETFSKIYDFK